MDQSDHFSPASHAETALARIRYLCEAESALFAPVALVADLLGQKRAGKKSHNFKVRREFRTIVAAVLNAATFNDIEPLGDDDFDENLSSPALVERREQQADRLRELLLTSADADGLSFPECAALSAEEIIREWQPTARKPEIKVDAANGIRAELFEHFEMAAEHMEIAAESQWHDPHPEDIDFACTVLRTLEPDTLDEASTLVYKVMMCNMALVAVRLGNTVDPVKRASALRIFEALYKSGDVNAAVHITRMGLEGWGTKNGLHDLGKANDLSDKVYAEFIRSNGEIFCTAVGLREMLEDRLRVKHKLIMDGTSDRGRLSQRIYELRETLVKCKELGFDLNNGFLNLLTDFDSPALDEAAQMRHALSVIEDLRAERKAEESVSASASVPDKPISQR